jgi:hypothetical protein
MRNSRLVLSLHVGWDRELHLIAERKGVAMEFAKTAAEAWHLLRAAICQGAVRASGILGDVDEPLVCTENLTFLKALRDKDMWGKK